jgi:glycerate kinase
MAALGGELVSGFDLVADMVELAELIGAADLVITGEGLLDAESFQGKAVGGVCGLAGEAGVPVIVVCGDCEPGLEVPPGIEVVSLVDRVGRNRAEADAAGAIVEIVGSAIR